jgi:hypothetical protein
VIDGPWIDHTDPHDREIDRTAKIVQKARTRRPGAGTRRAPFTWRPSHARAAYYAGGEPGPSASPYNARVKGFVLWSIGVVALVAAYGLFELPGLLIGLFVGAGVVGSRWLRAGRRERGSLARLVVDDFAIDLSTMTMVRGSEEYTLRRSVEGKWECRATSQDAIGVVVNRRMTSFTNEEEVAFLEKAKALMFELAGGDSEHRLGASDLAKVARALPPGSLARKETRKHLDDIVGDAVKSGTISQDKADDVLEKETEMETLEALQQWLADENGGFEALPFFESPVETAYQRYIRQG